MSQNVQKDLSGSEQNFSISLLDIIYTKKKKKKKKSVPLICFNKIINSLRALIVIILSEHWEELGHLGISIDRFFLHFN